MDCRRLEKFRKKDGKEEELGITGAIPIRNVVYDDLYEIYGTENVEIVGDYKGIFLYENRTDSTYTCCLTIRCIMTEDAPIADA